MRWGARLKTLGAATILLMAVMFVGQADVRAQDGRVRIDAAAWLESKGGQLEDDVAIETTESQVGLRRVGAEALRIGPGAASSIDIGPLPDLGRGGYLALQRFIPEEQQTGSAAFVLRIDGSPLFQAHNLYDGGGGPLDTLIVPLPALGTSALLEIENRSDHALYVTEVLLFTDVEADPAMDVYLLTGDLRRPDEMQIGIGRIPYRSVPGEGSRLGIAVNWPFLGGLDDRSKQAEVEDMVAGLTRALELGAQLDMRVNIKLTSDWGGWPVWVDDGQGGRFGDLQYQQIMYSPQHVRETPQLKALLGDTFTKEYGLTTPNTWSTQWLTYNHPDLNAFLVRQYGRVASLYDQLFNDWVLEGGSTPLAPLSAGTESLYWSREKNRGMHDLVYTRHNDGIDRDPLWGDFNPYVVEAARRDGIELVPEDGLDETERWWLHQNLARYTGMIVDALYHGQGGAILHLSKDGARPPITPPRHNMYTEPYCYTFYPLWDEARPMMHVGVVPAARPGCQWFTSDAVPFVRKQREFGRTANPNFEWTGIAGEDDALAALRAAYALGNEYVTLYNWQGDIDRTRRVLERYEDAFPVVWSHVGTLQARDGGYRQVFRPAGHLQLANLLDIAADKLPTQPVSITLSQRVFLTETPLVTFYISPDHAELLDDGHVRLHIPEMWVPTDTNYVIEIDAAGWELASSPQFRFGLDLVQQRGHSQLIQSRGEALRLLELIEPAEHGLEWHGLDSRAWLTAAQGLYADGQFEAAIQAAMVADGLRLPMRALMEPGSHLPLPGGATLIATNRMLVILDSVVHEASHLRMELQARAAGGEEPLFEAVYSEGSIHLVKGPENEGGVSYVLELVSGAEEAAQSG